MAALNTILLSYPTYGPSGSETPSATYIFFSRSYKPPVTGRSIGSDMVHNRNGVFNWVYDNGPNLNSWDPFDLVMEDTFSAMAGGNATTQYQNLLTMWNYTGQLQLGAPEGIYSVRWATGSQLVREFRAFPETVGDKIEYAATVQFQQA